MSERNTKVERTQRQQQQENNVLSQILSKIIETFQITIKIEEIKTFKRKIGKILKIDKIN